MRSKCAPYPYVLVLPDSGHHSWLPLKGQRFDTMTTMGEVVVAQVPAAEVVQSPVGVSS